MKKNKKLYTSVMLASVACLGMLQATSVAEAATVGTKGDVTFIQPGPEDPGDGVTKPDTEEDIIVPDPEDSGSTKGPLRLSHVPNFHFGTRTISASNQVYNPTYERFKETNAEKQPIGEYLPIPHFVQVVDERGQLDKGWVLSVTATKFEDNNKRKLENTFIRLNEQKLFNNVFDYSGVAGDTQNHVEGFANGKSIDLSTSSAIVMRTKPNQTTGNSKTSSMFNTTYTALKPVADGTTENKGVELHTPAKDMKETKLYTSVITWSLVDGI